MPTNNEIIVFSSAPIHASVPRLQVGAGETRTLIFRVFTYGDKGPTDLSGATGIALTSKPVMGSSAYPTVLADSAHPLADWANGKVAITVGPANVTNAESLLNMSLVKTNAEGHVELIARGLIEVASIPGQEVGALVFPGVPTLGTTGNRFTHVQSVASDSWEIEHNLDGYPSLILVDDVGVTLVGVVTYPDRNNILIQFVSPVTGAAHLN